MKMRCSHILLSHIDAEPGSHLREPEQALWDAEDLKKEIEKGNISFQDAAEKNSGCASGPRNGGDLGWFEEWEMPPDFINQVKNIPIGSIGLPFFSESGVHLVLRTG